MKTFVVVYLAFVALNALVSLYGPTGSMVREKYATWWTASTTTRARLRLVGTIAAGLVLGPLLTFLLLVPKWRDRFTSIYRRTYLDRDGLLTPQMPARRCPRHDVALDRLQVPCDKCKDTWDIDHCSVCCDGTCSHHTGKPWSCPRCTPWVKPCPWCKVDVSMIDLATGKIGMQHVEPVCDDWKKCAASGDVNAYIMDALARGEIKPAEDT